MRRYFLFFLMMFMFLGIAVNAYSDYLEVRRDSSIYAEPSCKSRIIEKVAIGNFLVLLDNGNQENGYYNIQATVPGQSGWIYRNFVRRHPNDIPTLESSTIVDNPLQDSTSHLTPEQKRFATRHLRLGKPQVVYERIREGYVLAQDSRLKIPLWVQYEISPNELDGPGGRRDNFQPDMSIPSGCRAELSDYSGSGYDRGHMAPAADMNRSQKVMDESFLLSNMCPQVGIGLNRELWADLEKAIRGWVEQRGTLTIITGPIFTVIDDHVNYKVIGKNMVAVPTHFYKIVVDTNNTNDTEALAFIIPNQDLSGHDFKEFLTSIDEIERETGLDFLSSLPVEFQKAVETNKAEKVW